MTKLTRIALMAVAGLSVSTAAMAQDALSADAMADADPETRAMAEKINTPSTEGVVTDAASCDYEGGSVVDLQDGTACFIQIRGEDAATQIYDGQGMGVIRCSDNGAFTNEVSASNSSYCVVYLTEKKAPKTREEIEAELAEMTARELAAGTDAAQDAVEDATN